MNPSIRFLFLVATGSLLAVACASVPNDAPKELHSANTELQRSKDLGSEDHFPKTIAHAESEFDKSLQLYKDSQRESIAKSDDKSFFESWDDWSGNRPRTKAPAPRTTKLSARDSFQQSIVHANRAKELASGANQLSVNMKSWDNNVDTLQGNYSIPKLLGQVQELKEELGRAHAEIAFNNRYPESTEMRPIMTSPFARLADFRIAAPVAYFRVGSATIGNQYKSGIEELAASVRPHREFKLAVVGYADTQGPEAFNDKIAQKRAETVAALLENEGIAKDRITVESMGAQGTTTKAIGQLQLERRVVVMISVAPTE